MPKQAISAIGTTVDGVARPLSKGQKAFNALIAKIEKRRAALAEWEAYGADFQRKYNDEVLPLREGFDEVRIRFLQRLDVEYGVKARTKTERTTIAGLIAHVGRNLLRTTDDPIVVELYRRYSEPVPPATPARSQQELSELDAEVAESLRRMLRTSFNIELGDDDSPVEVFRRLQEQMDEESGDERKREEARAAHHAKRKKTPRQNTAEERARAEEAEVHQSIRDIYRKLVSMLHPDREPDPVERERKAALMQRVNGAYASKSLLELLEIQLELEHIDQAALENISEDRLKRWNTILKDQLEGLEQELDEVEHGYRVRAYIRPFEKVSPKTVKRTISQHINDLHAFTDSFKNDLYLLDDPIRLKSWLKDMKWDLANL